MTAGAIPAGGGEMGALARTLDWSRTAVGAADGWPQSLRTALSILLESKFPMLLCWGPELIQFYNDPFRPILGATKHPALGRSTSDTFAEAWHIIGPLFDQVLAGQAVGFDDMLVPLDRYGYLEECYFVYSYSPIRDESGGVGGVLVTCTETSGRVIAERRLETLRALASCASQTQDVRTAFTSAAAVLADNPADVPFTAFYALDPDGSGATLVHASLPSLGPPRIQLDDPAAVWPLARAAAGEPQLVTDVRRRVGDTSGAAWPELVEAAIVLPITRPGLPAPDGLLVAGISPRRELDDRYRDFLALVADQIATAVANARAYEEERRRSEMLVEIDRQKTAFFSNVSHEFRTPLTLLLGPVEDALTRVPAALSGPEVSLVHRNAVRLLRLVNSLLDFSRIEAGRTQAVFEETDLAALTRDLASTFQSLMDKAGLTFEIDCPPLDSPVFVDRSMWEKVVLNLLSNAFKFTFTGGVRVVLRGEPAHVELRVEDTGTGIPAADLSKVFDRFHRVEGARSRSFEGSGIGLALVRELARMHDGDVAVSSVEGRGATFTVRLPAGRVPPAPASREPAAPASSPAEAAAPYVEEARQWQEGSREAGDPPADYVPARADSNIRVLVVDDNADMRNYLGRLLGRRWTVDLAAHGRLALACMSESVPDVIVTDVMMPEMDGIELLRRVKNDAATRNIPVIMLSARAGEDARIDGLSAGADDYLVKPFSARELMAHVQTQIEVSRLRRETAAQNERLLTLIDVAPAAIAVVRGPTHVFELANELYVRLAGRRDLKGKPAREALPELEDQGVWDLFDGVYATGEPFVAREFLVRLDRLGTGALDDGYFDFVLQPLKGVRGQTEGILIHAVEITEQVVAKRQLDDARAAAEAANRAKDEFMAMLGHELRNPLAPILTALQLMALRGDIGAEKERAVIERQVRHVVRLVDDLLDVSRIARGKIELKREPVEIGAVVAKAVETASSLIEQKHQELVVEVAASLGVDGDPTRLQQVLFNLLHNAAKYTEPRGRIVVTAAREGDWIAIRVRDSGIGIDAEMLPRIFDLFVQERQAFDRAQGGLGLGLSIVRNLVELHGGQVAARSDGLGRGSEFLVRLPPGREEAVPRQARPSAAAALPTEHAGLRVLIVDDNEDAATFLAEALAVAGFDTRTAADGPAALEVSARFAPHVALLDLGLPVMDGYELAERLRLLPLRPRLVAHTGYGMATDRARSHQSGFDDHVVKPADLDALIARLGRLAREARAEHAAGQVRGPV